MGSALPADTEASDTPATVYREHLRRSSVLGGMEAGNRETGAELLTQGKSLIEVGFDDERRTGYWEPRLLSSTPESSAIRK
jgi:hypothetical protein